MAFVDNLKDLPPVTQLAGIELLDATGKVMAVIENKPGQAGSLAVYAALAAKHGDINAAAAHEGLALYAEHTADALAFPGKHPNIDRLVAIKGGAPSLAVKLIRAS